MRVLHIIPSIAKMRGGPSQAIIQMVASQRNMSIDAAIVTSNEAGPKELDVEIETPTIHEGVPVIFFERYPSKIRAIREFIYSNSYAIWLRKNISNYDVIHVHAIFSFFSSYAMYQARKQGVPYVVRTIGQLETWSLQQSKLRKSLFLKLFERKNLEHANAVQCTSVTEQEQALLKLPMLSTQLIPLGIELPEQIQQARQQICSQYELNPEHPIILFLGRIHPKKGLEPLIKALAQINMPFSFVIAGSGDTAYVNQLKTLSSSNGINEQCKFIGFKEGSEKSALLQGADIFALTSHSENFGIAVLEALAHGTPTIVSTGVALASIVGEKELGWVTSTNADDITRCVSDVLENESSIEGYGIRARDYVSKHFHLHAMNERLVQLYRLITQESSI